jgi:short subunit dehydrogenase-like uncharacterized protein
MASHHLPDDPKAAIVTKQWMIYGAYGYTGELIAREAVRRGQRPILAGRSEQKLLPLANELGLEHRAFDLAQAKEAIGGITVLLNCAGPFAATVRPFVEACLHHRVHYIDITGEIPVFQFCHSQHARAQQAGIILCPGAGFDIVPTDCLAGLLKEQLPDATEINLAFTSGSRLSHGTAKTMVEGLGKGGMIRRNGELVSVPSGYRLRRIPFTSGTRWTATFPWGDVFTAGISTGVPNTRVYVAAPLAVGLALRIANPLRSILRTKLAKKWLGSLVERRFSGGPPEHSRTRHPAEIWGEAINADGRRGVVHRIVARLMTPNGYTLTADTAVEIATHCLDISETSGHTTASILMGSRFILSRPGVTYEAPSPA